MCYLVGSHCLKYGTAAGVIWRESCEMLVEMAFDLTLGFDNEAEAGAVAE